MKKGRVPMTGYQDILRRGLPFLFILSLAAAACSGGTGHDGGRQESNTLLDKAKELYEKAKRSGDNVPEDIAEWMHEDIQRVGDWEYRIVTTSPPDGGSDDEALETLLNELGQERWDCFWIERKDGETRFFLKRPSRSYLKSLPMRDFLKLVPQEK